MVNKDNNNLIRASKAEFCHDFGVIHFVGIGGIGMSGIAEILHHLGYQIQGSDLSVNDNVKRLKALGINIYPQHDKDNIKNTAVIVKSSAINNDNVELIAGREMHIPIILRSEMLAELMRFKKSIVVSGSHGKTTTTSMVAAIFDQAGLKPTVINGGIINSYDTNAYLGNSDYVVAEADESDGTFVKIPANIGIITNIDEEHIEYYGSFTALKNNFRDFLQNLPFYGFGVVCIDDLYVQEVVSDITDRRIITYGIEAVDCDIRAVNIRQISNKMLFDIVVKSSVIGREIYINDIRLSVIGIHNILNSLSAIAVAIKLGISIDAIKKSFINFTGVKRRFTEVKTVNNIKIIDDYAHHPREIRMTLAAARSIVPHNSGNQVIAIMQPHRYSRLKKLFADFVDCFNDADYIFISDVYAASEQPIEGINSNVLVGAIKQSHKHSNVQHFSDINKLAIMLSEVAKPGDIIIFMGAGTITKWAYEIPNLIKKVFLCQ